MTSSNHKNIQNCTNSLFLRKPLIFRWMILRTESIVLPPFFYILAAEKEKLNTFWRNCTGKNNPVHPLVVWINININSVDSAVFRPHLILSQTEGFCKKISQFLCAANHCGNLSIVSMHHYVKSFLHPGMIDIVVFFKVCDMKNSWSDFLSIFLNEDFSPKLVQHITACISMWGQKSE